MLILNCNTCKKEFTSIKSCKTRIPKFCSKECYAESLRMHKKCFLCEDEIINKHSVSLKNRKYCSKDCQGKARKGMPLSNEWKLTLSAGRKNSDKCKGANLYNYELYYWKSMHRLY